MGKWNKMNSLLKQLSQDAENAGSANMSLEEINLEIDAARKEAEITKLNQKKSEYILQTRSCSARFEFTCSKLLALV